MDVLVSIVMVVAALAVVVFFLLAAGRFLRLRSTGTAVLLRQLPASGLHGWRHGVVRYSGDKLSYFKLRSISPSPDRQFNRHDIDVQGTRPLSDDEAVFISEGSTAVKIRVGATEYEFALSPRAAMAFHAWLEASPSARQERMDYQRLRQRAQHHRHGHS